MRVSSALTKGLPCFSFRNVSRIPCTAFSQVLVFVHTEAWLLTRAVSNIFLKGQASGGGGPHGRIRQAGGGYIRPCRLVAQRRGTTRSWRGGIVCSALLVQPEDHTKHMRARFRCP